MLSQRCTKINAFFWVCARECFQSRNSEDICCFSGEPPGRCYERYKQPGLADQTAHFCTIHILIESLNDSCTDSQTSLRCGPCRWEKQRQPPFVVWESPNGFPIMPRASNCFPIGWIPEWHRQLLHMPSMIHFRSRIQFCVDTRVKVCIQSLVKRGLTDSCAEVRQVVCWDEVDKGSSKL